MAAEDTAGTAQQVTLATTSTEGHRDLEGAGKEALPGSCLHSGQ